MKTTALSLIVDTSLLVGAIALLSFSNSRALASSDWETLYACEDNEWEMYELASLDLSDDQQSQMESLDDQLAPGYEALEAQLYVLEAQLNPQFQALDEQYEAELVSILTPQQAEQLRLNILTTDFPELDGITLNSQQIETLWQMSKAFDADLHQVILSLSSSTAETSEAEWEAAFEALEATYDQQLQDILTPEQYQQWNQNLESMDALCEA